jgi:hypothetical protein
MYGKPYRGFESLSLRHAVWNAENSRFEFAQNARILPFFVIIVRGIGLQRTDYHMSDYR